VRLKKDKLGKSSRVLDLRRRGKEVETYRLRRRPFPEKEKKENNRILCGSEMLGPTSDSTIGTDAWKKGKPRRSTRAIGDHRTEGREKEKPGNLSARWAVRGKAEMINLGAGKRSGRRAGLVGQKREKAGKRRSLIRG